MMKLCMGTLFRMGWDLVCAAITRDMEAATLAQSHQTVRFQKQKPWFIEKIRGRIVCRTTVSENYHTQLLDELISVNKNTKYLPGNISALCCTWGFFHAELWFQHFNFDFNISCGTLISTLHAELWLQLFRGFFHADFRHADFFFLLIFFLVFFQRNKTEPRRKSAEFMTDSPLILRRRRLPVSCP